MICVALVSHKNKVQDCWRNPEGWVPALLLSPSLPLAPRPTARLVEFKPGHVLIITLPQWPCWAQHLESHKNIIVQLLGSFVHYHKDSEKTKMLPPLMVLRGHIFQILPLLLSTHPPSRYHIAPTLTHFTAVPTGHSYTSTFRHEEGCLVKMLPYKIAILCFVLPKSKTNNKIHSLLHTSSFQLFVFSFYWLSPTNVPVCHLSICPSIYLSLLDA